MNGSVRKALQVFPSLGHAILTSLNLPLSTSLSGEMYFVAPSQQQITPSIRPKACAQYHTAHSYSKILPWVLLSSEIYNLTGTAAKAPNHLWPLLLRNLTSLEEGQGGCTAGVMLKRLYLCFLIGPIRVICYRAWNWPWIYGLGHQLLSWWIINGLVQWRQYSTALGLPLCQRYLPLWGIAAKYDKTSYFSGIWFCEPL